MRFHATLSVFLSAALVALPICTNCVAKSTASAMSMAGTPNQVLKSVVCGQVHGISLALPYIIGFVDATSSTAKQIE